jgi:hypothetical protein
MACLDLIVSKQKSAGGMGSRDRMFDDKLCVLRLPIGGGSRPQRVQLDE